MWKDEEEWSDAARTLLSGERLSPVDVNNLSYGELPFAEQVHLSACGSLPDTFIFCSWDRKDTITMGVLLPREHLWPGATILNASPRMAPLDERALAPITLQYDRWMLPLHHPIFALFHDDAMKTLIAWHSGLGVSSPASFHSIFVHVEWFGERHVLVQRTLRRKRTLFSKTTPVEEVMAQAHLEMARLSEMAHHALRTPIHLPPTLTDAMAWIAQRFFHPEHYPQARELRDAYFAHGSMILQGWWLELGATELITSFDGSLKIGAHYHSGIKHFAIQALRRPVWRRLRQDLMRAHLDVKNSYVSAGNNSRKRQSLPPMLAWQALLFAHQFRFAGETEAWFQRSILGNSDIMSDTFEDIEHHLKSIYFAYAIEAHLMAHGFDEVLEPNESGALAIKNWVVHEPDGHQRLRLDDPRFMNAFVNVWSRHAWRPDNIPHWIYPILEARFIAGDLRVADVLVHHPDHVRILREVCGAHIERIRWMVSWLGYHPRILAPSLMPALFKLSTETIGSLNAQELSALYEHLERADSALRRQHLEKTRFIVKVAIQKLGASSFDLLDDILRDALDADIMAYINQHIEALPRLSTKRRALKREQREALAGVDVASFQGQISLHQSDGTLRGALSQDFSSPPEQT